MSHDIDIEQIQQLLESDGLPADQETSVIELLVGNDPAMLGRVCGEVLQQRRKLHRDAARSQLERKKAAQLLEKLQQPPLHPATVLRVRPDDRLHVLCDGRRLLVSALPDVDLSRMLPGDEVFLDTDSGFAVALGEPDDRAGVVGTVADVQGGRVMVQGAGDEEVAAVAIPSLVKELRTGDRVVYTREFPCVIERLPARQASRFALDQAPREGFRDIGGLDALIGEMQGVLGLHLLHPEIVDEYRLALLRGITLVGVPGVGKTLFAKAVANYLAESGDRAGAEAQFIHVKPGSLRGIYYGQAEARIRELFETARAAPGLVVMFFDELDSYGSRGEGIGQDIDGRVLGALLAEMDGLASATNVLCIGATNRLDLCDSALVRRGRMGDRIFTIPRPDREATREILRRYLAPELHYAECDAPLLVEAATSYVHSKNGGAGIMARATLRGGDTCEIHSRDLLNGALLASAVEDAKHAAALRAAEIAAAHGNGEPEPQAERGITHADLLCAIDVALAAEAKKISAPQVARQMLDLPRADEIDRVDVLADRSIAQHEHLRVA